MKGACYLIVVMAFIFLGVSCSVRYKVFSNAAKELREGSISRKEYDSIVSTFYVTAQTNFTRHSKVKVEGSYVCTQYSEYYKKNDYRALKFTDSSVVFKSLRFYDPLHNNTLAQTEGVVCRYTTKGGEVMMEYLLNRDHELYNVFKYAKVSVTGDTLTFYRTEILQRPHKKKMSEQEEMYVYNPKLTATPRL